MEAASMVVETQDDIEEGELSDYEYIPLARPSSLLPSSSTSLAAVNSTRLIAPPISSDEHDSSESDSDSDGPRLPKAPRLRKIVRPSKPAVPAKYTVWCQDIQEAALNEQLLNCDVELKYDKSRDVESYDYIAHRTKFDADRVESPPLEADDCDSLPKPPGRNKRYHDERGDLRQRLGRKGSAIDRLGPKLEESDSDDDSVGRPKARLLAELKVNEASPEDDVTLDIASKLYEEKESLVGMTVKVLGVPRVIRLFNKVRDIEADGGMMILNGARRRTPGGVFFYLLRNEDDITREQHDTIFAQDEKVVLFRKRKERQRKRILGAAKLRAAEAERLEAQLPALLTRAEQMAKTRERGEESGIEDGEEPDEPEAAGSNPPPSPAADNHEQDDIQPNLVLDVRHVANYDDDFLDVGGGDDIDMF